MRSFSIGIILILLANLTAIDLGSGNDQENSSFSLPSNEGSLYFIENRGQLDREDIDVYLDGRTAVGIGSGVIQFTYREGDNFLSTVQLEFVNSMDVAPLLSDPSPTEHNFFKGPSRENWITGAGSYGEILYRDIYPRIDLRVHSEGPFLKYDLIVHPGGDAGDIKIRYKGADNIDIVG